MRILIAICICLFLASCDNSDDDAKSCSSNWSKCGDNADLVNNWSGISSAQVSCQSEAENRAQYGTPKWPWLSFSSFYPGTNYVPAGKVILIEPDAQFQNGFSALVHSKVWCLYDLRAKTVTDVAVAANDSDEAVVAELQARQWIPQEQTSGQTNNGSSNESNPQQSQSAAPQTVTEPPSSVQPVQTAPPSESETPGTKDSGPQAEDVMASRIGNTVLSHSRTAEWHLWYRADGTFTGREDRSNHNISGTWTKNGDSICLIFQPPYSGQNPSCQPVTAHQVGDIWYSNGATLSLIQGIQ
jgi:hypothetical protein